MAAFYGRHDFPKTKADKKKLEESQELEVGDVVPVAGGADVNKSYAISDDEDDEDGEEAGAAADACGEAAAAAATAAPAAAAAAAEAAHA